MAKKASLLVNLGSPDSTQVKDVRRYLDEFLMDERVIDLPYWKRFLLVRGIILNFRPKKSAAAYRSIWWDEGSPLIVLSQRLLKKVQQKSPLPVALGMRYGNPSIKAGIENLLSQNPDLEEVQLIPLYPQYAMSSYETVVVKTQEEIEDYFPNLELTVVPAFYNRPDYLEVLAKSIKPFVEGDFDHLLVSYHGVPERHIHKGDITGKHCLKVENCCQVPSPAHDFCYRHQCYETTRLLAQKLGIAQEKISVSFQSRLGRDPWLTPYTDATLKELGKKGVKKLLVACPAFVTDCLETLEEIAEEGKHSFQEAGGGDFAMIPCLNDRDGWADLLAQWIEDFEKQGVG